MKRIKSPIRTPEEIRQAKVFLGDTKIEVSMREVKEKYRQKKIDGLTKELAQGSTIQGGTRPAEISPRNPHA